MAPQVRGRGRTVPCSVWVCRGVQRRWRVPPGCWAVQCRHQLPVLTGPPLSFLHSLSAAECAGPAAEGRSETPGERELGVWGARGKAGSPAYRGRCRPALGQGGSAGPRVLVPWGGWCRAAALCWGDGAMQSPMAGSAPQELPTLILEAVKELEAAKQQVLKRIQIWKRQQQLAGNGALFEENLAPLQKR